MVLDWLSLAAKDLACPQWCSYHEEKDPIISTNSFKHADKKYIEEVKCYPCPTNIGDK